MNMNVSEMQSALARLRNEIDSIKDGIPEEKVKSIRHYLNLLESNIRKEQKKKDKKYKEDHMSFDPGLETGMDYVGDSESMDDIHSIMRF